MEPEAAPGAKGKYQIMHGTTIDPKTLSVKLDKRLETHLIGKSFYFKKSFSSDHSLQLFFFLQFFVPCLSYA